MLRAVVVFSVALAGCYEPPTVCGIQCTTSCPDGYTCTAGFCQPDGEPMCTTPKLDFDTIATGAYHTCGLSHGRVYCWGDNARSQLGLPGIAGASSPQRIGELEGPNALEGITVLAIGGDHTCVLKDGEPWCWGYNEHGQAAGATGGIVDHPQALEFGTTPHPPFTQLTAGTEGSCAIGAGELWCWGSMKSAPTGNPVTKPTRIGTLDDWRLVALGNEHGCGVSESLGLVCWGTNDRGQVGIPKMSPAMDVRLPTAVMPQLPLPVIALSLGHRLSCAIMGESRTATMGQLWCWGESDQQQIETVTTDHEQPTLVSSDPTWTAVATGYGRVCGIRGGEAYCWGREGIGGLGDGMWTRVVPPGLAVKLGEARSIATARVSPKTRTIDEFGCLVRGNDGYCWGKNWRGQLGLGTVTVRPTPFVLPAPEGAWTHVWAGRDHMCATTDGGKLWCWGGDFRGQVSAGVIGYGGDAPCELGLPCDYPTPQPAPISSPLTGVDELSIGNDFTCARMGGVIQCWGSSQDGQLGMAGTGTAHTLTTVTAPGQPGTTWKRVMGGDRASCGITTNDVLACWGRIGFSGYQTPNAMTQAAYLELMTVADISMGDDAMCAARSDGARVCFGNTADYRIGNNDATVDLNPAQVINDGFQITAIGMRQSHGCAIVSGSQGIKCWGVNGQGESGQPPGGPITIPMDVADANGVPISGCTQLDVSNDNTCALCNGKVLCWGANAIAELGRGTVGDRNHRAAPIAVDPALDFTEVAVRDHGGCALATDRKLWCWGESTHGQLGDGSRARNLPALIGGPP